MFKLGNIELPNGLMSLGRYALDRTALVNLTIPNTVDLIDASCFFDCSKLITIQLPQNLFAVSAGCFQQCGSLTSIDMRTVSLIGSNAFADCKSLTKIVIMDCVVSLGYSAFSGCSNLVSISFGDGLTELPRCLCFFCVNLTEVSLGNNIEIIHGMAFSHCSSLTKIDIGCSVKSIESRAFEGAAITSVSLPDTLTAIEDAFFNCTKLTSVILGPHISKYGDSPWVRSGVKEIHFRSVPDRPEAICPSLVNLSSEVKIHIAGAFSGKICGQDPVKDPTLSPAPPRSKTKIPERTRTLTLSASQVPTKTPFPTETLIPTETPFPTKTLIPTKTLSPTETPSQSKSGKSSKERSIVIGLGCAVGFLGVGVCVGFGILCVKKGKKVNRDPLLTIDDVHAQYS
jgi:hypothetical protein